MKVLIRIAEAGILAFLLLLTICTAAYRLDPDLFPEVEDASEQSLSDRITSVLGRRRRLFAGGRRRRGLLSDLGGGGYGGLRRGGRGAHRPV